MNVRDIEFKVKAKILYHRLVHRFGLTQVNLAKLLLQNPTFIAMSRVQPMFTLEHYLHRYFSVSVKPGNTTYVGFYTEGDDEVQKFECTFEDDVFRTGAFVVNEMLKNHFTAKNEFKLIARNGLCQTVVPMNNLKREDVLVKKCEVIPPEFEQACKANGIPIQNALEAQGEERLEGVFEALVRLRRKEIDGSLNADSAVPPEYDEDECAVIPGARAGDQTEFPFWVKFKTEVPAQELVDKIQSKGAKLVRQGNLWCAYIPTSIFKSFDGADLPPCLIANSKKAIRRANTEKQISETKIESPNKLAGDLYTRVCNGFALDLNIGANKHLIAPEGESGEVLKLMTDGKTAKWWKATVPPQGTSVADALLNSRSELENFFGSGYADKVYDDVTLALLLKRKGNIMFDRKVGTFGRK